jgi:hypothetical protein
LSKGRDLLNSYDNITIILEDIETLLDGLLLSGINVALEGAIKEIDELAVKCKDIGFKEGSELLLKLCDCFRKKRHSISFDTDEIVQDLAVLGTYVSVIKGKLKGFKIDLGMHTD